MWTGGLKPSEFQSSTPDLALRIPLLEMSIIGVISKTNFCIIVINNKCFSTSFHHEHFMYVNQYQIVECNSKLRKTQFDFTMGFVQFCNMSNSYKTQPIKRMENLILCNIRLGWSVYWMLSNVIEWCFVFNFIRLIIIMRTRWTQQNKPAQYVTQWH